MKSFFEDGVYEEITSRLNKINEETQPIWGKMQYKHLDHHFSQFGV